jgi:predicted outer membrane repeat protein
MSSFKGRTIAVAIAACVALVGCSSGGIITTPTPTNISGDYAGTLADAQNGSSTATATFAQNGASAGGAIAATWNGVAIAAQTSLTIASSNAVTGTIVIDTPTGGQCTFSTTGSYDTGTNVLSGTYRAITNCAGDSGSYTLTQRCTATATSAENRRNALTTPVRC